MATALKDGLRRTWQSVTRPRRQLLETHLLFLLCGANTHNCPLVFSRSEVLPSSGRVWRVGDVRRLSAIASDPAHKSEPPRPDRCWPCRVHRPSNATTLLSKAPAVPLVAVQRRRRSFTAAETNECSSEGQDAECSIIIEPTVLAQVRDGRARRPEGIDSGLS